MITVEEAINIVRKELPKDAILSSVVEDDLEYEFRVIYPEDLQLTTFSNSFCCSVNKKTGKVENSAMLQYYELFEPEKADRIKNTMRKIDII